MTNNVAGGTNGFARGGCMCLPTVQTIILRVNFTHNRSSMFGGVGNIRDLSKGIDVYFEDCYFFNNSAGVGGCFDIYHAGVTFVNSSFLDNTAVERGGVLNSQGYGYNTYTKLDRCLLANNSVKTFRGGALYSLNAYYIIANTTVSNNSAPVGGAFGASRNEQCFTYVLDSYFYNNRATAMGGAFFSEYCNTYFNFTTLEANTAAIAGAIYLTEVNELEQSFVLNNSVLVGNSASQSAGAVMTNKTNGYIHNTTFVQNEVNGYGGALYLYYSYPNLAANDFRSNFAAVAGGAIYRNESCAVDHADSSFSNNLPDRIGGLCITECNDACRYCDAQGTSATAPDFCVCRTPAYILDPSRAYCMPASDCTGRYYVNTTVENYYMCSVDHCGTGLCSSLDIGGVCVNTEDDFYCRCTAGYTGRLCTEDEDGCLNSTCSSNAYCEDIPAPGVGYTCVCNDGYSGDGYECHKNRSSWAIILGVSLASVFVVGGGMFAVRRVVGLKHARATQKRARQMTFDDLKPHQMMVDEDGEGLFITDLGTKTTGRTPPPPAAAPAPRPTVRPSAAQTDAAEFKDYRPSRQSTFLQHGPASEEVIEPTSGSIASIDYNYDNCLMEPTVLSPDAEVDMLMEINYDLLSTEYATSTPPQSRTLSST
eukprot:GCRY01004002.1.p1 GENE.GCRY01004002.1~~GCRY01004002.1.p1  ORF type:complete len:650 (-),score=157.74 GCRY01004002.1:8-1957(-)